MPRREASLPLWGETAEAKGAGRGGLSHQREGRPRESIATKKKSFEGKRGGGKRRAVSRAQGGRTTSLQRSEGTYFGSEGKRQSIRGDIVLFTICPRRMEGK